jgi:hypothetical protein
MPLDRPKHGAQLQELHDRLVLHFPPRPCWPAVVFVLLWLTLWTIGGIDVVRAVVTGNDSTWHLLELGPFAVGELFLTRWLAREIWEHEFLVASFDRLEVRRDLGRISRSRSCPVGLVRDVRPVEMGGEADEYLERFRLEIVHRHGRLRVGDHLTEPEAEHVASVTRSWLTRHAGWVQPDDASTSGRPSHVRSVLFPALVVVLLAGLAVATLRAGFS